ncbi:3-deoxy-7-phosphoheptulonate synthase class II [Streptomyces sp. NPDC059278]|uniref:3-deoxy-7-phosphoheptulonate synthase class II n=1 Tax=Streptomyces sp. NPDC059278 TaxID=3346801 RepID=UPI0036AFD105
MITTTLPTHRASTRPATQQPDWPNPVDVRQVTDHLAGLPPLVGPVATARLRERLAVAASGGALMLQGGHCAETFGADSQSQVAGNVSALLQMARVLTHGTGLPVTTVGRMAGQYAKPRSRPTEVRHGLELPVYRGDAVNGPGFNARERLPDPRRMETAYQESAATLQRIASARRNTEFHVSHEALLLPYEEALVRTDPDTGGRYAGSGHMLWIGERTRQPDGAHVEFAAHVENPVGVKIGPGVTADELLALIDLLDPDRRPGRLTLITRMGADRVRDVLPELVEKVTASGSPVLWVCDPMHGNTRVTDDGAKTRRMADIVDETAGFVEVHRALGTHPGGLHLEMTGSYVTECLGGSDPVRPEDLGRRYTSACDPRLNRGQSLDLAHLAAGLWRKD